MKRPILSMLLSVLLLLPGCTQAPSGSSQEEGLTVLATTYPVYLFARTVAQGVEGVTVERLNTGSVSCLHDYTLSVDDMKKIEGADVIAMNGAGLEDFMDDALAASSAAVIDCSQGVALLENADHIHEEGDGGHDHAIATGQKVRGGGVAQSLHIVVDVGILLDVGVGLGNVRFRLVVVVVGNEVAHRIVRHEFAEFGAQLRGERLVRLDDKRRSLQTFDQPR